MTNQAAAAPVPGPSAREPETAARSSANMAVGTLASRILGFLKGIVLGAAVGGSQVSGVFEAANTMPNIIYLLVAGGVFNAVLIPQIIKASKAPDRGADFISRLLTLAVIFLLAVTVLLTVAVLPVMMVTTDFSGSKLALVTAFATLLLPQIFFYGLYSLLGQVLNAHGSFTAYAWAPVVNNIVAIAGLGTFIVLMGSNAASPHSIDNWTPTQTLLLAGTATLGIVLQSFALLWPLKKLGLGLRPRWGLRGVGLRATGHIAAWTTATMVVGNLTFLLIERIATIPAEAMDNGVLDKGAIIAGPYELGRATELYILPHSVIALSIATVLFTRISRAAAAKDDDGVRMFLSQGLRTTGVATVFGAVALLVLSGPFGMLFSGASRQTAVNIAITLAILAVGSPFLSANFMMTRVFYQNSVCHPVHPHRFRRRNRTPGGCPARRLDRVWLGPELHLGQHPRRRGDARFPAPQNRRLWNCQHCAGAPALHRCRGRCGAAWRGDSLVVRRFHCVRLLLAIPVFGNSGDRRRRPVHDGGLSGSSQTVQGFRTR
ncbi:murein biosynthesis integral membrane protein MurJ [Paenarthrobacter sp. Z7-10]|uniref:murein biosynthesis integral membrane protein MurJ n=1 Tax=Paenarthrobacter sp. Z7-10 TaxID=2787635 RepID=UPI0022A9709D|nr:lipid II flippase MurJ [Paenarthrobacter sp. Z7-10]